MFVKSKLNIGVCVFMRAMSSLSMKDIDGFILLRL